MHRSTWPLAAARHWMRFRSRFALMLGPILLLLLSWSSGLAQDLPTAPVHVAAASADSVGVSVDLSDPTKFPLSSTGKWTGYLEFLGKPGTERSLGQPDLFIPFLQDTNDMTFLNIRGQLQFDNTDVSEYNIGLGHRHMFTNWIIGGYGYFDHRNTQLNNSYRQFTGGLELMSVDWAFRMNGYLPENKIETSTSGANVSVIRPGDQINVQVDGIVQEKALPGLDGEVGYLLPIPWKAYRAVFDETRVYAGGYHFLGEDQFESVTGPRGRVEWRAYDLPVLGPGSRFMMGVEAQWDEPRGSQAFGLASLRIPFDVFADKSTRKQLTGLDRRMLQPVIRDVDIVTSEAEVTEILPALNIEGKAFTKAVDVTTVEEMEEAIANNDGEVLAIFLKGDKEMVPEGKELHMMDTGEFTLGSNQTLSSYGKELMLGYVSRTLGAGDIGYTPDGTPVGITGSITMGAGSHLNAMVVDATGYDDGILIPSSQTGKYWLTNSTVMNSVNRGVLVEGSGNTLIIRDSTFTGNTTVAGGDGSNAAIVARNGGHIEAEYILVSDNLFQGVLATGADSYIKITHSEILDNEDEGLRANSGALIEADYLKIGRNRFVGVGVSHANSLVRIKNSLIWGTRKGTPDGYGFGDGLNAENGARMEAENVEVFDNEGWGVGSWGNNSHITIKHSRIFGNALDGFNIDAGRIEAFFVEITGNGEQGVDVMRAGTLLIEDSLISENGSHGLYSSAKYGSAGKIDVQGARLTIENNGGTGVITVGGHIAVTETILNGNGGGPTRNIATGGMFYDEEIDAFDGDGNGCFGAGTHHSLSVNDVDIVEEVGTCITP